MKKSTYYCFYDSWQLRQLNIAPDERYVVKADLGELRKGETVTFVGFDDVDNHFGIFVFTDAQDRVCEVRGDFSGAASLEQLKITLAKL